MNQAILQELLVDLRETEADIRLFSDHAHQSERFGVWREVDPSPCVHPVVDLLVQHEGVGVIGERLLLGRWDFHVVGDIRLHGRHWSTGFAPSLAVDGGFGAVRHMPRHVLVGEVRHVNV